MNPLPKSALRLLAQLIDRPVRGMRSNPQDARALIAADLAVPAGNKGLAITEPGRALLARQKASCGGTIDPFRAQHLSVTEARVVVDGIAAQVTIDEGESPLAWLARRKGRDGRALIAPHQFQAGERLRAEFDIAHLMPRTTSNWSAPIARRGRTGEAGASFTDSMVAARQRINHAMIAVGPEFSGLLLDICCFLKRLEDVEKERGWPPRSAKVVLQLALDRLARHYGFEREARGKSRAPIRVWSEDAAEAVREA